MPRAPNSIRIIEIYLNMIIKWKSFAFRSSGFWMFLQLLLQNFFSHSRTKFKVFGVTVFPFKRLYLIFKQFGFNFIFLTGCGTDWAVSPLSRLLTVLYLLVGLPVMYLYLMSTGHLLARIICISIRGLACTSSKMSANPRIQKSSNTSR